MFSLIFATALLGYPTSQQIEEAYVEIVEIMSCREYGCRFYELRGLEGTMPDQKFSQAQLYALLRIARIPQRALVFLKTRHPHHPIQASAYDIGITAFDILKSYERAGFLKQPFLVLYLTLLRKIAEPSSKHLLHINAQAEEKYLENRSAGLLPVPKCLDLLPELYRPETREL